MAKIITKNDCPYCVKLKDQLKADGIGFEEVDRASLEHFPYATVPQLWLDLEHIGGYSDYMEKKHGEKRQSEPVECEACQG